MLASVGWRRLVVLFVVSMVVGLVFVSTAAAATGWSDQEIAATLTTDGFATAASVSCASRSFCAVAGNYTGSPSPDQAFVSVYDGGSWSAQKLPATLTTDGVSDVSSVSCTSSSFCVAGGGYGDSLSHSRAFVSVYDGSSWSDQELAATLNAGGDATVDSVSCTSSSFCVAGGTYEDSSSHEQAFVSVYDGSGWSDQELAAPLNAGGLGEVYSVSCTSSSFCVAGGDYDDSSGHWQAFVSVYDGSGWSDQELAATLNAGRDARVNSVSCTSSSFCVAGGTYEDSSSHEQAFASVYNGSRWSDQELASALNTGGRAEVNTVSCTSSSFCVAGGTYEDSSGHEQAFVSVYDGSGWSDQELAAPLSSGGSAEVESVSCTSSSFCAAGGGYYTSAGQQAFVSVYDGSGWSTQELTATLNAGGLAAVESVSCTSISFCAASGYYRDSTSHNQAFVSLHEGLPEAPTNVTALAGTAAATVSWDAPPSDGGSPVTGYVVSASDESNPAGGGQRCTTTGAMSCTVVGLVNGDRYQFTVTAINAAGAGPVSSASNTVTPQAPAPPTPTAPTTTTPTTTPAAPPSVSVIPKITIKTGTATIHKSEAKITLACGHATCRGTLTLKRGHKRIARVRYTISAGARKSLEIKLGKAVLRELRKAHEHRLKLTAEATTKNGKTAKRTITLKEPGSRGRHTGRS